MNIRKFKDADAKEVSDLIIKTLWTTNIKDYSAEYIEKEVQSLQSNDILEKAKWTHFYVIEENDKIIGCGAIGPYWNKKDESILFVIFVLPEYQRKGIGTKIIKTLEHDEYFLRARRIEIPASITATPFYLKMGYTYKNNLKDPDEEGLIRLEKFIIHRSVRTPQDIYDFMEENIKYGWIDIYGKEHLDTMKDFRKIYKTMSIEESLEHKIGTCIEQVNLMHYLLNKINIKNKMYCCRIFEPDDYNNLEEDEHMHCFVLYYENGKVYHLEHPNFKQKGIYEYSSEEEAVHKIEEYYKKLRGGKASPTKEFFDVPVGITFKEFNKYINHI